MCPIATPIIWVRVWHRRKSCVKFREYSRRQRLRNTKISRRLKKSKARLRRLRCMPRATTRTRSLRLRFGSICNPTTSTGEGFKRLKIPPIKETRELTAAKSQPSFSGRICTFPLQRQRSITNAPSNISASTAFMRSQEKKHRLTLP